MSPLFAPATPPSPSPTLGSGGPATPPATPPAIVYTWRCSRHSAGMFVYRMPQPPSPQPAAKALPQTWHAPSAPPTMSAQRSQAACTAGVACAEAASLWD